MAKDFMAQMLDELMGRNRNAVGEQQDLHWDDESVCKHHLVDYCPNELFTNTKADLGICRLLHDDELAKKYRASPKKGTMGYEDAFIRFLRNMVQDVDRRIDRGRGRLEATRQVSGSGLGVKHDVRVKDLADRIEGLVKEAEELGSQGKVDEAQQKLRQSDQLRKDRDSMIAVVESAVQQEKQLEVCETCGAFLIVGDAQQRIDDHLSGKQHAGYARVKQTLKEEEERIAKELEARRKARDNGRENGRDRTDRTDKRSERSDHSSRDIAKRSRSRERDRERNKRHRTRSRSRDKDRDRRRRSRSRSKHSRSRGHDVESSRHKKRSESPSGRNSKSSRHDRNTSREKRRRSRSREEKRCRRSRSREGKTSSRRSSSSGSSHRRKSKTEPSTAGVPSSQDNQVSLDSLPLPQNNLPPAVPMEQETV